MFTFTPNAQIKVSELRNNPHPNIPFRVNDIIAETPKAYAWKQDGEPCVWIPKSQIQSIAEVVDDSGKTLWVGIVLPAKLSKKLSR